MPNRSPAHVEQIEVNGTTLVLRKKRAMPRDPMKSIYKNVWPNKHKPEEWKAQFTNSEGKSQALGGSFKTDKEAAVASALAHKFGVNAGSKWSHLDSLDEEMMGSWDEESHDLDWAQVSSSPDSSYSPLLPRKLSDEAMDEIMEGPNKLLKEWADARGQAFDSVLEKANRGRKRRQKPTTTIIPHLVGGDEKAFNDAGETDGPPVLMCAQC